MARHTGQGREGTRPRFLSRHPELLLALVIAAKSLAVAQATDGLRSPFLPVALGAASGLLLGAPALLLRGWWRVGALVLADVLVSALLLADLMFFSWFDELVPLRMAGEAHQVGGVKDSTLSTFHPVQLLLFADLVAVVIVLLRGRVLRPTLAAPRSWPTALTAVVVALAVLVAGGFAAGSRSLDERYATAALSRYVGPVPYHLYDLAWSAAGPGQRKVKANDLVGWEQTRRAADVHTALSGVARGSNLLVIQMEAMEQVLIGRSVNGQEVTPTMNRLIADNGLYFDQYHPQIGIGNTSDAELMSLTSLLPVAGGSAYLLDADQDYPGSLPSELRSAGFRTAEAFHGYNPKFYNRANMYPHLGFDSFHLGDDYDRSDRVGIGVSDESFFDQTATKLTSLPSPWFGFVISLSGHYPYEIPRSVQPLDIPEGTYSGTFVDYLQSQAYSDRALGHFLDRLRADGTLANTTVAVYGDHWGSGWKASDNEKFIGRRGTDYVDNADDTRVPLVISLPESRRPARPQVRHTTGGEVDLTPTLLDLLGIAPTGFYFGRSLLAGHDLVPLRHYSPLGSFIDTHRVFQASAEGGLRGGNCYDRRTHHKLLVSECATGYREARWRVTMSDRVIDGKLLPQLIALMQPSTVTASERSAG